MQKNKFKSYILPIILFALVTMLLTSCNSKFQGEEIILDFEWTNLSRYVYNEETGNEYLIFRWIPRDTVSDYDWEFIRVNAEDFQIVEDDKLSVENIDWRDSIDTSDFPFWEENMLLRSFQRSSNGSKSLITVSVSHERGWGTTNLFFLQEENKYTQIEKDSYTSNVCWATDSLIYCTQNPLDIYDIAEGEWVRALPEDVASSSSRHSPLWINEHEFLLVIYQEQSSYATRIDYLAQRIVTQIHLGDLETTVSPHWSRKNIGILWYQPRRNLFGENRLFRIDMNITLED
jgi:hypothetical protein